MSGKVTLGVGGRGADEPVESFTKCSSTDDSQSSQSKTTHCSLASKI